MTSEVQYIPPNDSNGYERWQRLTDDSGDIGGVEVIRSETTGPWKWSVTVEVMEFIREDPLETEIRDAMAAELRAVPRVARVSEEDREVWIVDGTPSGEMLTRAAAKVVDRFAVLTREHIESWNAED
jgi:hypothetical protein